MIKAWASQKSVRPKDGGKDDGPKDPDNNGVNFRGEKRSNETHESKTDPEARIYRKSKAGESMLCYMERALMENRNGLVVDCQVTSASGTGERYAAKEMLERRTNPSQRVAVAADNGYDANEFVEDLRNLKVRGMEKLEGVLTMVLPSYNLVRRSNLCEEW